MEHNITRHLILAITIFLCVQTVPVYAMEQQPTQQKAWWLNWKTYAAGTAVLGAIFTWRYMQNKRLQQNNPNATHPIPPKISNHNNQSTPQNKQQQTAIHRSPQSPETQPTLQQQPSSSAYPNNSSTMHLIKPVAPRPSNTPLQNQQHTQSAAAIHPLSQTPPASRQQSGPSTNLKYTNARVMPYSYHNGDTLFLLGRESQKIRGTDMFVWNNFGGYRDPQETNSEDTMTREASEESYNCIRFKIQQPFSRPFYTSAYPRSWRKTFRVSDTPITDGPQGVTYFREIDYIDPMIMQQAANTASANQQRKAEKVEWKWINGQEFLNWVKDSRSNDLQYPGLPNGTVYGALKDTWRTECIQRHIEKIINATPRE